MTTDKYEFERRYWGDCSNTYDEETKQYVYAELMGLTRTDFGFDCTGKTIIDIGGGPCSLLLKATNFKAAAVIDPIEYPAWTRARYSDHGILHMMARGEDLPLRSPLKYDEAWIYNVLQHVDDPELIIRNAKAISKMVRIFEWIDIPPHEGHPHELKKAKLDEWLGIDGKTMYINQSGAVGNCYYGVRDEVWSSQPDFLSMYPR